MNRNLSRAAVTLLLALASAQAARAQVAPQPATPPAAQQTPAPQSSPQPGTLLRREDGHEWAPILEQKVDYKDWTFKSLKDGSPVNLRELSKGKKLVLVVYFAPWCGNWKNEAPTVWRLYEKYKSHGFEVVGVSEYAAVEDSRRYFESQGGAPFPVVVESEAGADKEKTTHYAYRKAAGDPRNWGSPFNVFLEPAKLNASGELLTEKAWVVGGELIEKDVERFVRERLGIKEQGAAAEQCKDEPQKTAATKQ